MRCEEGPMSDSYGRFSDDGSEFIITTPRTPRPWINYLTNGDYCALCSQVGGGFSFYRDHRVNAVLRRGMNQHLEDLPGRFIYVKDERTGDVWCPGAHPIADVDDFRACHGMGYTRIESVRRGVRAQLRFFVPPGIDAECWMLELANDGPEPLDLSVYSFADLALGNVSLEEQAVQFMCLFNETAMGEQEMIFHKRWWHSEYGWHEVEGAWPYRAFATTSVKPVAMLANRDEFFGAFRLADRPEAIERDDLPDAVNSGKDLAAVFQWRVTLEPGKAWHADVAIGVQPDEDTGEARARIRALQDHETYRRAWEDTLRHWRDLFDTVSVETPVDDVNRMGNWWNKWQLMVNFYFGRGPSYYHKGQYPAMRDSCQDAFGVIPLSPALARRNLVRIGGFFFADGRAGAGCNRIGVAEPPSIKVDLPLWYVLAVCDYLRETADDTILDESVALLDGGRSTVYEKMRTGIERMIDQRGPHGLPLIGKGDWNDAASNIGPGGKGESVWLAQFLYFVIHQIAPVMRRRGDTAALAAYERRAAEIRGIVNDVCWDGEWFVRAFRDDGRPVGVRGEKEGTIWINSQTWAVIAGISDRERLGACLDAVEAHMGTPYGLTNLAPAFTEVDETIGLITRFRAGWKENGAVFSHASAFNVVARAMLGRGREAVDLYRRILPCARDPRQYLMEPYAFSQFCAGPAAGPEFGRGAFHWLTGTAAWMFRALTDYIIGVRADWDGLLVAPAVDPSWTAFGLKRTFRGSVYHFEFANPDGVETGVREIILDGTPIAGNLVPAPTQPVHHVRVVMGR